MIQYDENIWIWLKHDIFNIQSIKHICSFDIKLRCNLFKLFLLTVIKQILRVDILLLF
jgi:hypothetical protein